MNLSIQSLFVWNILWNWNIFILTTHNSISNTACVRKWICFWKYWTEAGSDWPVMIISLFEGYSLCTLETKKLYLRIIGASDSTIFYQVFKNIMVSINPPKIIQTGQILKSRWPAMYINVEFTFMATNWAEQLILADFHRIDRIFLLRIRWSLFDVFHHIFLLVLILRSFYK